MTLHEMQAVMVIAGYILVIIGSLGMMAFATKFGFSTDLDGYRLSPVRLLRLNGAQVWSVSWAFILVGAALQLVASWQREATIAVAPVESVSPAITVAHESPLTNVWDRTRQCADQVERMASREAWSQGGREPEVKAFGWSSHYSPKFQRCFVRVSYFNSAGKTDKHLPLIVYILFDAFENRDIATCTDALNPGRDNFCSISEGADTSKMGDCSTCRQFVTERMNE